MPHNAIRVRVLVVGAGPVGLALAGDLGWRGIDCLLIEQSDGAIYQPKMDLVGIRTMEHCRRWGIVRDVENSPYPRDYPQDNVYLTSLGGYELGREQFPPLGEEKPPPPSPQKRERCPQNLFDPILRAFAGRQKSVELQYLTKLTELRFGDGGAVATVIDQRTGEQHELHADFIAGCDGAHSTVREVLGIRMIGNPALTYTTNIIFRCADLAASHPGRKPYRYIFVGPEGTWATIVAINGGDQWRMSIIGGQTPRDLSTDEIHAAIRRAIGPLLPYDILSVVPWIRKELVAEFLSQRSRVHPRRRRPRHVADRRLRDEHRDWRCGRPGMETYRCDRRLGRGHPAQFLRRRASPDCSPQREGGKQQFTPHAVARPQ